MSAYVLSRALPSAAARFDAILRVLAGDEDHRYALAELNDLLCSLTRSDFPIALEAGAVGVRGLSRFLQNYLAAMVEQAADRLGVEPPPWVRDVQPLEHPHFTTPLRSARLHLLRSAPVAFKRRNLFVDAALGDRV
jgi:hypothetical protein